MTQSVSETILASERRALDRWGKGDPDGFLDISASELTYFDPFQEARIDGLPALTALYETIRGKIHIERDEIVDPRVQVIEDAAVLTYRFVSQGSEGEYRCTELYQRLGEAWKIVHSHWSFTNAGAPSALPNG